MGVSSFFLCPFIFAMMIVSCQASHHVWDEANLMALQKAKAKEGSDVSSPSADRTAYHFQPVKNWMNDPTAPMFYNGYYHLFYQYNPFSAVWGSIRWGHAVSTDLINWQHLDGAAIYPDAWYDINGAWSGSATFLGKGGAPAILYTGNSNASEQVTAMAIPANSSDPKLLEWIKIPENPVMLPVGLNSSSFRDPTTAWLGKDNRWRVLVGNKRDKGKVGMALLYRSKDFKNWVKAKHPLHFAKLTGMWECSDFYPVSVYSNDGLDNSVQGSSVKHVLKNSLDDYKVDYYTVGKYFRETDRYVPDNGSIEGPNGLRYDYGKFYASKTFYDDNKGRRILWGWINESDSVSDDITKGWACVQGIPRVVRLDTSTGSSLIQWPVSEVEALRDSPVINENIVLNKGKVLKIQGLMSGAEQVDVEAEFELGDKLEDQLYEMTEEIEDMATAQKLCMMGSNESETKGLGLMVLASEDLSERTVVSFRFFKHKSNEQHMKVALCVDQSRSSMAPNIDRTSYGGFVSVAPNQKSLSLRVLVDHTIVESFAEGGKTCITSRSYPTMAAKEDSHLFVFNNQSGNSTTILRTLTAWHMKGARHQYAKYV